MVYYIQYLLVRLVILFAGLLPLEATCWIAKRVSDLAYLVMAERRKIATGNVRKAFGTTLAEAEIRKIARHSFRHIGISFVELFLVPKLIKNAKDRFLFTGLEHLQAAFAKGKGVLFVISHVGSWEYLSFLPYLQDAPSSVVVKSIKNPYLDREIDRLRRMMTVIPVPKKTASKKIFSDLRQNRLVAILIDQWSGAEGLWTPFFGVETSTTSIPARVAQKTGCALIPGYCIRKKTGFYEIQFHPEVPLQGNGQSCERETTEMLNRLLEAQIRKYPEQWTWGHRRWKPKPSMIREPD
ncbi:MAG: lysophospholipid acyltransferase family protein [Candidatus Omnitrophica bacterium]|nr:lysophospholipid acyltransferase family protein [Candidatus Omnitrophota bacterium]MDD5671116.1 lysophospholipid acyltransferase family protein [Candidatus Omnitrophota bacterium]